jgi:hypothetical protein
MTVSLPVGKGFFKPKTATTECGGKRRFCASSHAALAPGRQLLLPRKGVSDDGIKILKSRAPRQRRTNPVDIRHQCRRVAWTTTGNLD